MHATEARLWCAANESFALTDNTALEKTSSEVAIDEAAQDFVDSDENLNKALSKQDGLLSQLHSGYPYAD